MSNIEHLIENALTAMSNKPRDTHQAFAEEISAMYNKQMLQEVSITEEELWAIAQYVFYTWETEPKVRGHYITDEWGDSFCSVCGENYLNATQNYCPNCGAHLRGYNNSHEAEILFPWENGRRSHRSMEQKE